MDQPTSNTIELILVKVNVTGKRINTYGFSITNYALYCGLRSVMCVATVALNINILLNVVWFGGSRTEAYCTMANRQNSHS